MWSSGMTWASGESSGSGVATSIADGATLEGQLIAPTGTEIVLQAGSHLSLPQQARVAGAIASPTIRSGANPDTGIADDADADELSVVKGGVPYPAKAHEPLAGQAINAVGNTISHGTNALLAVKTITPDANRTLTSNPCIQAGVYDGQLLLLRGGGAFTTTLPHGNGVAFAGATNKALGPADYMLLRWAASLARWEQVTAVVDL